MSLTDLNIHWNYALTSVDLSGLTSLTSLGISNTALTSLDLNGLTSLTSLGISGTALTSMDFSGLTSLTNLDFSSNSALTSLDLSGLTSLTNLDFSFNTALTSLDLSGLTSLTNLDFSFNTALTSLDLSGLTSLTNLDIWLNYALTSVDLSGLTSLTSLGISGTALTSMDLSGLTSLTNLDFSYNSALTSLDLSGLTSLTNLDFSFNSALTSMDLSGLTSLTDLNIYRNAALTSVDLSGLTNLTYLKIRENAALTSLDLSGLTSLTDLKIYTNAALTSLDLSGLTSLTGLGISGTALTSMDLSGLTSLTNLDFSFNTALTSLDFSGLTSLTSLGISNTALTSLDFSALTSLTDLNIYRNFALTSVGLSGLTSLTSLVISSTALTSVDLSELTNLTHLKISSNAALTSLDLSALTSLTSLGISNTALTSVDLSALTSLTDLNIYRNAALTSLDLSALTSLTSLGISYSALTSVDLSGLTNLTSLQLKNNEVLSEVFLRSHRLNKIWYIEIEDLLKSLRFICANPQDIPEIRRNLSLDGNFNCLVASSCGSFGENIIEGAVIYDDLKDGCDDSDVRLRHSKIEIQGEEAILYSFTNSLGEFNVGLAEGAYIINSQPENRSLYELLPEPFSVELTGDSSYIKQDFCVQARNEFLDLETSVAPSTQARPGFLSRYLITYANKGTARKSGTVDLVFEDNKIDYISADLVPDTIETGRLSWNFNELLPFESRTIEVTMELNRPTDDPPLNGGDILRFITHIEPDYLDVTPENNIDELVQRVVNSYDPNDKSCLAGNVINPDFIDAYVKYLIRFENTGSAEAIHVLVEDEIDTTTFDINTLEIINSSHPMEVLITEGNHVSFQFDSILLPFDDANNDGFVLFKIKTKPTLEIGDTLQNIAAIYFDYNLPIITNNAITRVDDYIGIRPVAYDDIEINLTPNPAHALVDITAEYAIQRIELVNSQGQTLRSIDLLGGQSNYQLDVREFTAGMYVVRLHTSAGIASRKLVKQ